MGKPLDSKAANAFETTPPFLNQQLTRCAAPARFLAGGVLREKGPGKVTFVYRAGDSVFAPGFCTRYFFGKGIKRVTGASLWAPKMSSVWHSYIRQPRMVLGRFLIPTIRRAFTVGLILHNFTRDAFAARSVGDVESRAALHEGRVKRGQGIASGLASPDHAQHRRVVGARGPVVHLGWR